MASSLLVNGLKALFLVLWCLMVTTLIYTISIDGLPFRWEILTRWMAATLVDFYINVVPFAVWVSYKESSLIAATLWVILLVCLGRDGTKPKGKHSSVAIARILFSVLGCLMLGILIYTLLTDGSPFRKELLTPWMTATLIDFCINVVALSVWVAYKESNWTTAFFWIVLLISFGSITTCAYIVKELFKLAWQDPLYLILIRKDNRAEHRYESL
ncbi:hypothetical protein V6Z12_D06G132800 [Gossypium hirsutum]